ncbi:hypothetical protein DPX16_3475 [Anabarilius grahami]|uniref:Reverse transcriptase domain-containing protein n=1 Tax=Anabarilius grahami TaxID=495550 RepID=A0A3N0XKN5_ANAGA|nr:hypothetical protein DPX16_3475 [Anabarilius grahami]
MKLKCAVAVDNFAQQFSAVQKQTETIKHILPRGDSAVNTCLFGAAPPPAHHQKHPPHRPAPRRKVEVCGLKMQHLPTHLQPQEPWSQVSVVNTLTAHTPDAVKSKTPKDRIRTSLEANSLPSCVLLHQVCKRESVMYIRQAQLLSPSLTSTTTSSRPRTSNSGLDTTAWQHLEVGIMAGCTISPLAFTLAMEVIIQASRWTVGGQRIRSGLRLPPVRAYMDVLTTLTTTKVCTVQLLRKLRENIERARMKIKPSKSRSISIIKGKLSDHRFHIGEEPIPTVSEKPVKSLGRCYDASLKDKEQVEQLRKEVASGLEKIDRTLLPGKLKLWCMQSISVPKSDWMIRLLDSNDPFVAQAAPILATGRKWTPLAATEQAKAALRHKDIVGRVQEGRSGLGLGASTPVWSKASPPQRRKMVVQEATQGDGSARKGPSAGSQRPLRGCGKGKPVAMGKARAVDDMGRSGEEEDLLERAVGDGGIQGKLYHQGCLRCPTFSRKPKPMVCRRPHVPSMPKSSNTEAHLSGMQDQPHPRPLHLAAQPGAKVSCSSVGKSTDKRECPSSPVTPVAANTIWSGGLLREMGVREKAHRQAVKDLSAAAEKGSQWLWMFTREPTGWICHQAQATTALLNGDGLHLDLDPTPPTLHIPKPTRPLDLKCFAVRGYWLTLRDSATCCTSMPSSGHTPN